MEPGSRDSFAPRQGDCTPSPAPPRAEGSLPSIAQLAFSDPASRLGNTCRRRRMLLKTIFTATAKLALRYKINAWQLRSAYPFIGPWALPLPTVPPRATLPAGGIPRDVPRPDETVRAGNQLRAIYRPAPAAFNKDWGSKRGGYS